MSNQNNSASITTNEAEYLNAIIKSEFQEYGESPIGHDVFSFSVHYGGSNASKGGVASSLTKKGLIEVSEYDGDDTCCITQAGFDAIRG